MKLRLLFLLMLLSGFVFGQSVHRFTGSGSTSLRIAQPGYDDSAKYLTYFATEYAISPGDTIILAGTFNDMDIYGYRGTAAARITIIGDPSNPAWIKRGLRAYDISNFNIVGDWNNYTSADTTNARTYNLRFGDITQRDAGIDVLGRIKNITIKNVKITDGHYAVRLKTDPPEVAFYGFCDSSYVHFPWRANNNIIDSILIEAVYARNLMGDPFYIGNTNPFSYRNGETTYYTCNGVQQLWTPMRMGNVVIRYCYSNIAGRTPIQLSGAEYGKNEIYGNYISNAGDELNQDQGTGIAIGGASKNVRVYNNRIKKTFKYAIFDIGFGTNYVYNNWTDSIGYIERYIESGAYNLQFPYRNRDSTIVTETSNFEIVGGDKVKNIQGNQMVTMVSKPASVTGYVKNIWIFNNIFGLTSGIMADGALAWRQDDGLNENWGTDNYFSNNTNRVGGTPHVWSYIAGGNTYAQYSTSTPPEIPEDVIPPSFKMPKGMKLKF